MKEHAFITFPTSRSPLFYQQKEAMDVEILSGEVFIVDEWNSTFLVERETENSVIRVIKINVRICFSICLHCFKHMLAMHQPYEAGKDYYLSFSDEKTEAC